MMKTLKETEWYHEFVNLHYKTKPSDSIVLFRCKPAEGISSKEAAGRIASESSAGTWTKLTELPKLLPKVKAYAYEIKNRNILTSEASNFENGQFRRTKQNKQFCIKVAYPSLLFEKGSIPAMLSGFGGNIFGMKALQGLRLQDATLPPYFINGFKGPTYGTNAIRKIFKRKHGPITTVVPKPKLGYTSREHAEKVGLAIWQGGIDCLKDDENLTNQSFNKFDERVKWVAKCRNKAEKETGDVKDAFLNVTAPNLKELERRIKLVHNHNFRYFMIDVMVSGFTAVQTASDMAHDLGMAIHGHRAMHAAMTRNPSHGISMLFLAKLMRLIGIDQLHIGTVIGKLEGQKEEIIATKDMIIKSNVPEIPAIRMPQKWKKIKPMLPVASGGLHPGLLPTIFDIYGTTDIVLQVGGGTQGHPMGIEAGAKAVIQSIESYRQGISLEEYAQTHKELATALKTWGKVRPM